MPYRTLRARGTRAALIRNWGKRVVQGCRLRESPAVTDAAQSHLPTVCNPASPACLDPALPTHITSHGTESTGSSTTSSTNCPCLSLKLPRNLNPSCDLSIMRQENIF